LTRDKTTTNAIRPVVPSVDLVLREAGCEALITEHGRPATTNAVRAVLDEIRRLTLAAEPPRVSHSGPQQIVALAGDLLVRRAASSMKRVFNLTGTVLHTNLGRAPLPPEAIAAMAEAAANPVNVELDLDSGKRGDRDSHVEELICELTGAEAATVVNNNAAAVLLSLNSLANRREVPVSRGELIEIGGSFRIPDIMKRAGAKLVEVGTTNRTHLTDFSGALSDRSALLMKVHTSNYTVEGFTASVPERALAALAHDHDLPFIVDLGSGTLADFEKLGLPPEPTPAKTIADGADLVTFSGDKLLGGPQAGLIAGRADLVQKIRRNPMKRALRLDKVTIAGLAAVLRLYRDPDRLADRIPTLRLLTRPQSEIVELADRLVPVLTDRLDGVAVVDAVACHSQIGSGALPSECLPSAALRLTPVGAKKSGRAPERLAAALRSLPIPVIGRIQDAALVLDLRCLENEAEFVGQLEHLKFGSKS
jgi:L-seryl-tRNA(Ser) seleniumtransferase